MASASTRRQSGLRTAVAEAAVAHACRCALSGMATSVNEDEEALLMMMHARGQRPSRQYRSSRCPALHVRRTCNWGRPRGAQQVALRPTLSSPAPQGGSRLHHHYRHVVPSKRLRGHHLRRHHAQVTAGCSGCEAQGPFGSAVPGGTQALAGAVRRRSWPAVHPATSRQICCRYTSTSVFCRGGKMAGASFRYGLLGDKNK